MTVRSERDAQPESNSSVSLTNTLSRISPPPSRQHGRERRNPSVTPRKFNKFFAPRPQLKLPSTSSRRALHDITFSGLNRSTSPFGTFPSSQDVEDEENLPILREPKRRKSNKVDSSPLRTPVIQEPRSMSLLEEMESEQVWDHAQSSPCAKPLRTIEDSEGDEVEEDILGCSPHFPVKPIVPMSHRGLGAQILSMSISGGHRHDRQRQANPTADYRTETANFATESDDVHMVTSFNTPGRRCIPFCLTPCNTNSLIALGDEEGRIRLIETNKEEKPLFKNHYLATRVHMNAVMDMAFSEDDRVIATGGGDQTCRIVDMATQTTLAILVGHSASIKQVRFQPGSSHIIATSSRDGTVRVWDTRCKGDDAPQHRMFYAVENDVRVEQPSTKLLYARPVNTIYDAHRAWSYDTSIGNSYAIRSNIAESRAGPVSITAMEFLPIGKEHFLLTGSEAEASVRLWDIRFLYSKNKATATPISATKIPETHNSFRHYGVNSININTDGSRFYTLCKDHTVYAYSTAHLITGTAPELSTSSRARPSVQRKVQEGLGPLYGFRHPQLHCTSFYTKSAIRPAKDGRSEMLAVGSNDQAALLFPTDECYLPRSRALESTASLSGHVEKHNEFGPPLLMRPPTLRRVSSSLTDSATSKNDIMISNNGTPLVRGHAAEVNGLTWSHNGSLVTIGDDYLVRCWREGPAARRLRTGGEGQGRRWLSGWADVGKDYDQEDFDEV